MHEHIVDMMLAGCPRNLDQADGFASTEVVVLLLGIVVVVVVSFVVFFVVEVGLVVVVVVFVEDIARFWRTEVQLKG